MTKLRFGLLDRVTKLRFGLLDNNIIHHYNPVCTKKTLPTLITVALTILYGGCTVSPSTPPMPSDKAHLQSQHNTYIVQSKDTLYSIAKKLGKNVSDLAQLNHLQPPYTIYPGQTLLITATSNITPPCPDCKQVYHGPRTLPETTSSQERHCYPPVSWQWPTQSYSKIVENNSPTGSKSINLFGQLGQPIYAAAAGTVTHSEGVYNGFSNLIIIQHNQAFSSVYANTRTRRVQPGTRVQAGQLIADMGTNTQQQPTLYFEIRCWDKTVAPLESLPKP